MPAFNPFAGGISMNKNYSHDQKKNFIGPIINHAHMHDARVYMLDGTFLGELGNI